MPTEGRRRRRNKGHRKSKNKPGPTKTTVHDLPDHLLVLTLLRLGSPLCLFRAAASCWRWHRLAGFRRLHPPHAGEYHNVEDGAPLFVPADNASPAALINVRRFSLDSFLGSESWKLADSRGSLLLLYQNKGCAGDGKCGCGNDLVVCDPLTRRSQGILWPAALRHDAAYLLHGDDAGSRISLSNFRIVVTGWWAEASVFSPGSGGGWRQVRSTVDANLPERYVYSENLVGRANGSINWGIEGEAAVLALDETTVSLVMFPDNIWGPYDDEERRCNCRVIGSEDGALRVVRLVNNVLKVFSRHGGAGQWVMERLLRLPGATMGLPERLPGFFEMEARIVAANDRYVLVTPREETWVFTVHLDTIRVDREHKRKRTLMGNGTRTSCHGRRIDRESTGRRR